MNKLASGVVCDMVMRQTAETRNMKRTLVVVAVWGLAANLFGQAVYLKVVPVETRSETKKYEKNIVMGYGSGGSFRKTSEREEVFNITVRNMAPAAYEYTVEWMFFAAPASGGKAVPFHAEEKKLSLDKNGVQTFEVCSPKLEVTQTHYSFIGGGTRYEGMKFAGYVVRVKHGDKILAVESADAMLKRQFQDPKAKWGVPEPAEPAKTKRPQ